MWKKKREQFGEYEIEKQKNLENRPSRAFGFYSGQFERWYKI